MTDIDTLQRIALAIAIGLLVGIERGWQEREARDGARAAGIRTYTLIGLLGGIWGILSATGHDFILGIAALSFALPFAFFEWQQMRLDKSVSSTGFVAGFLTFALGAYAVRGNIAIAAGAAVAATVVLSERRILHSFLRHMNWLQLRAALLLLVMSVILLPALPDRTLDPWNALNPHQMWLMTILVAGVCYAGYISMLLAGERKGLLYAGALGGLVTSTTVTWTFARLARNKDEARPEVMTAILAAWIVSLLRMTAIAIFFAPALLNPLGLPILAAALVLLAPAVICYRTTSKATSGKLLLKDPFELLLVLRFALLLAAIMLLAKVSSGIYGHSGLFALGATSGLLDVDPITLSVAKMAGTGLDAKTAALVILTAAAANGLAKSILAIAFGGLRLGMYLSASALVAAAAGTAFVLLR
jgi:uncharacterized membrane protein (DUF4010 family)